MINIKSPSFTFGIFLIIFMLVMLYYGKEIETTPSKLSRMIILVGLWLIINTISIKYNKIYGWSLAGFFMILLLFNLWYRVKYVSDPNYYDTLDKMIAMKSSVNWNN